MINGSELPKFSRSSIWRNGWFWVVVEEWGRDPVASGIARSPEEALKEAVLQCGQLIQRYATLAKSHWAKQRAIKRHQSVASAEGGNSAGRT